VDLLVQPVGVLGDEGVLQQRVDEGERRGAQGVEGGGHLQGLEVLGCMTFDDLVEDVAGHVADELAHVGADEVALEDEAVEEVLAAHESEDLFLGEPDFVDLEVGLLELEEMMPEPQQLDLQLVAEDVGEQARELGQMGLPGS
jgi:hypothetical protein